MVIFILIAVVLFVFLKGPVLFSQAKSNLNANVSPTANPAAGRTGVTNNDIFQSVLGILQTGGDIAENITAAQDAPDKYGD